MVIAESRCSLCGETIPGVYVDEECWCGRCVEQNPEVFGIGKPEKKKHTERRVRSLLREFHDLQKERIKLNAKIVKVKQEILFSLSMDHN